MATPNRGQTATLPELTGPARGAILRGAHGQDPAAPSRLMIAPPMRREAGSRYFDDDSAVAIFVAHHYPTIGWHEHDFYELAVISTGRGLHESEHGVIPGRGGHGRVHPAGRQPRVPGLRGPYRLQLPVPGGAR
jgi:hypothetical protein